MFIYEIATWAQDIQVYYRTNVFVWEVCYLIYLICLWRLNAAVRVHSLTYF